MCGLAGFCNLDGAPADRAVLDAMTDLVRHRGPDDRGTRMLSLRDGVPDLGLGFQRLKILDLSDRGRQPMAREATALFNGAIYNAAGLRAELQGGGCQFRSATDTEVILALYEQRGLEAMLERLNGMFALVIADTRRKVLHLVRDHLGIKPLYWTQRGSTLLFASEAKAFLAHPAFRAEIDPDELDELLAFRYVAGPASLLKGVRQVQPGHVLTVTPEGIRERRYWCIPEPTEKAAASRREAVDRLEALLESSVSSQLRGDVPIGCQLSGGIDSSLVTVLARAHHPGDLHAFSVIVDHPQFSEEPWIDAATSATGILSHRQVFDAPAFLDALDAASWHMDAPIGHPNALALWCLSREARAHVRVLLTGEGADELFAGYARFAAVDAAAGAGPFIRATRYHSEARLMKLRPGADLRPAIAKRWAIFDEGHADPLSNCVRYELRTHLADLLDRQDRMAMAHGVETRLPFLDRPLIEFARGLPSEHLMERSPVVGGATTKVVLKELAARRFGASFAHRRKSAFNLPLAQYFRTAHFVELMEDRLLPGMAARGLVDVAIVRRWWRRALSAPSTTEGFWIPVALELWAQQFIDRTRRSSR